MEDNKTITGIDKGKAHKHLETLTRRLSYLEERFLLKNNSFDGAECAALRHCIWLLTLEMGDQLTLAAPTNKVLTDEKTGRTANSGSTSVGSDKPKTTVVLRKATKYGVDG